MATSGNKLKSHRGAAKRFKKRGTGYKFRRMTRNHILTKKSKDSKRQKRNMGTVHASNVKHVDLMLAS